MCNRGRGCGHHHGEGLGTRRVRDHLPACENLGETEEAIQNPGFPGPGKLFPSRSLRAGQVTVGFRGPHTGARYPGSPCHLFLRTAVLAPATLSQLCASCAGLRALLVGPAGRQAPWNVPADPCSRTLTPDRTDTLECKGVELLSVSGAVPGKARVLLLGALASASRGQLWPWLSVLRWRRGRQGSDRPGTVGPTGLSGLEQMLEPPSRVHC